MRSTRAELIEFYGLVCNLDEHTATLKWKKIAGDTAVFEFHLFTKAGDAGFEITPIDIMVFDADGKVIEGLYAAGNDMASILGGNYSGGGITLGPGMTYGYIAGKHVAGVSE